MGDPTPSFPDVLCDPTDFLWRKETPFEAMTGRTAPSSDGLLATVFLSHKANARRSVHSPRDHFIIALIISDWRDTRSKWPLARNPDRSWWHHHTGLKLFFGRSPHGQQGWLDDRATLPVVWRPAGLALHELLIPELFYLTELFLILFNNGHWLTRLL